MEFKKVKLGEVARVKNGYAFKSKDFTDYGIPIIKIKNICPPLINIEECNYVSEELYNQTSQYCILKGDILISMTGSGPNQMNSAVGKVGRYLLNRKALQNQRVGKIEIIDEQKYDKDFLYYYLSQKNILEYFVNNSTGSANQANISKKIIENLMVPDFLKSMQRKIANILNALDSKIEINNKIISNLESQAQAIFKSWFVDFEPFQDGDFDESELGMIPEGWEVKELGEVADCKLGGTPSRKKREFWDGDIPWINSGEVNKDRIIEPSEYITEEGLKKSATKLLKRKTTLVAITGATLGQVSLLEIDCCTNQSIIGIEPNEKIPYEYIYLFIKNNINKIISNQTGAAQQHINLNDIRTSKIIIPQNRIMKEYVKIVSLLMLKVEKNYFENTKLAELRDALLPKLMAGEIDVSNIKIEGEEVKNE
ncbi:restriction endonuclease subunit S [Finegoldia magna]|uniref:restriction endonuclease subunit S n=1 Tax=Finegoldia magna TaxID=1260 RepID=UPI001CE035C6|nr:restriction endonuclease subunit S [Finegoldia magna]MCA5587422.1 restriction endonuclease subunit S [Finegoldia magna]